eukprot:2139022-Amphidinium_carterae.1
MAPLSDSRPTSVMLLPRRSKVCTWVHCIKRLAREAVEASVKPLPRKQQSPLLASLKVFRIKANSKLVMVSGRAEFPPSDSSTSCVSATLAVSWAHIDDEM